MYYVDLNRTALTYVNATDLNRGTVFKKDILEPGSV